MEHDAHNEMFEEYTLHDLKVSRDFWERECEESLPLNEIKFALYILEFLNHEISLREQNPQD
jgi:hypothetical protein